MQRFQIFLFAAIAFTASSNAVSRRNPSPGFVYLGSLSKPNREISSAYYLSTEKRSHDRAQSDCRNAILGTKGKLVMIEEQDEADFIRNQLNSWGINERVWTGGENTGPSGWFWYNSVDFNVVPCTICKNQPWTTPFPPFPSIAGEIIGVGGTGDNYKWENLNRNLERLYICEAFDSVCPD